MADLVSDDADSYAEVDLTRLRDRYAGKLLAEIDDPSDRLAVGAWRQITNNPLADDLLRVDREGVLWNALAARWRHHE